jgi:hypothetical protein
MAIYSPVPPLDGEVQRRPWSTLLKVSIIDSSTLQCEVTEMQKLTEVNGAAHINLSNSSADRDEVGKGGGSTGSCIGQRLVKVQCLYERNLIGTLTSLAVKVCDTKNVDIAAVQVTRAAAICLTLDLGGWDSHGSSEEAEEGDE